MIDSNRVTNKQFEALRAYQNAAIALAEAAEAESRVNIDRWEDVTTQDKRMRPFLEEFRNARTDWEMSR